MKRAPDDNTAARRLAFAEAGAGMLGSGIGVAFGIHGFTTERRWLLLLVSTVAFALSAAVMLAAYHWGDLSDRGGTWTRRAGHAIGIVIGVAAFVALVAYGEGIALGPTSSGRGNRTRRGMRAYAIIAAFVTALCVAILLGVLTESWIHNDVALVIAIPLGVSLGGYLGFRIMRAMYGDAWDKAGI